MKFKVLAVSAIVAGFLIGCGSSGSSSNDENTTTAISGTAVDEIIQNGVVEFHKDSPNGEVLARTKTDENGTYSTDLNYKGVVVTTVKCDENSTFKEENGSSEKCDLSMPLMSVANVDGTSISINVSPMTTQLVALATNGNETKSLSIPDIRKAKETIAYMYGIDPITSNPVTDDTYKKQIASLHKVARDNNISMDNLIKTLTSDAKDGIIGDDNSSIISSIKNELKSDGIISGFIESNNSIIKAEDIANGDISYSSITLAKKTFETVRTQLNSVINDNETGTLNKEIEDIQTALHNDTFDKLSENVNVIVELLGVITDKDRELEGTIDLDNGNSLKYKLTTSDNKNWNYTLTDSDNKSYSGTITANIDTRNLPEDFTQLSNNLSLKIDGKIPADTSSADVKTDIVLTKTSSVITIDLNDFYVGINGDNRDYKNVNVVMGYHTETDDDGEKDLEVDYVKLNSITLNTDIDNRFNFNGILKIDYIQNQSVKNKYSTQNVEDSEEDNGNDGYIPNNIVFNGKIKDKNKNIILEVTKLKITSDDSGFDFANSDLELPVTITLGAKLKRPNYADTILNATYKVLNTKGDESLSLKYTSGDSDLITMNASYIKENDDLKSGKVEINSINGLNIKLPINSDGDVDYSKGEIPVTVNNEKVGELQDKDNAPVVKYLDGSFESIN